MKRSALKKLNSYSTADSASSNLVKIGEASQLIGVSIDTLRRWEKRGWLRVTKTPGGTRLYDKAQLLKLNPGVKRGPKVSPLFPILPKDEIYTAPKTSLFSQPNTASQIHLASDFPILKTSKSIERDQIESEISNSFSHTESTESSRSLFNISSGLFSSLKRNIQLCIAVVLLALPLLLVTSYIQNSESASSLFNSGVSKFSNNSFLASNDLVKKLAGIFSPSLSHALYGKYSAGSPPGFFANKNNKNSDQLASGRVSGDIKGSNFARSKGQVLADSTPSGSFLQINLDAQINGSLSVDTASVSGALYSSTINTGFGDNEVYPMNQPLLTTSAPTFAGLNLSTLTLSATSNQLTLGNTIVSTQTGGSGAFTVSIPTLTANGNFVIDNTSQTLTNKTISGSDNTITNIPNSALSSSSITINTGSGLSGGGSVSLGGSITISSTGSTSAVNSITGTTDQIIASSSTGDITLSLPQSIAISSDVEFDSLELTTGLLLNGSTSGTITLAAPSTVTSYTFTLPTDDGTSGYVLQTDGSGNTSWVAQSGGGAGTLQSAYDGGNTITTTTGRNIAYTLASGLASSTSFTLTNAGTANAFVLNDTNAGSNISLDIQSGGVSSLTITESGTVTTTGNISTSAGGTINSDGTLTASNGFTMSTGAVDITATSGSISATGLTALTYTLSSGTAAITAPTLNLNTASTGNTSLGNATGTFALTSSGLNVSTGGALTGVTSIDTISTSATALTFAGGGTVGATSTALNLQADGAVDVNIAGGNSATGCTITNSNGNLACTGTISSGGTVLANYWDRTGTTLSPVTAGDNITTSGNISTSGSGTITSAATLTASNGFTMTTGALSLTSTSGAISSTGLTGLTYTLSSGTVAITAPTLNLNTASTGNTAIGNATGTFALTSNGGLNVTTGGALTGVASIDTIAVTATGLTFAGAGTISSTTSSAITLDSGTTGTVNLGTGNNAKTINVGTGTAGNIINIGTNNTVADAINIGSALDTTILAGTINISGLSASSAVYTDASKNLTSTAPTSGTIGYWSRSSTTLSPATANDVVSVTSNVTASPLLNLSTSGIFTGTGTNSVVPLYANSATTGDIVTLSATSLTSGTALTILGSTTSTDSLVKFSGSNSAGSGMVNSTATLNSGASIVTSNLYLDTTVASTGNASAYGLYSKITDGTANGNVVIGSYNEVASTANVNKGLYGTFNSVTTNSTTADTTIAYAGTPYIGTSGIITTGTRNTIAYYASPGSTAASTGGTTEIAGFRYSTNGTLAVGAGGTISVSAYYVGNPTMNTTGTSTKVGIRFEDYGTNLADNNYAICFDCDGTYTTSSAINGLTWGNDANSVNLYRSASDTLTTDDNFTLAGTTGLTFTGVGGQINFTNGETIDNDTNNQVNIGLGASGSLLLTSTTTASITNSAGALNINAQATALNLQADGSIDVNIAGGSGSTGCTIANSSGNLTCTGALAGSNFSGSSSGTNTGDQNLFSSIVVPTQTTITANSTTTSLNVEAGSGVTLATDNTTKTLTISATGTGGDITAVGDVTSGAAFTNGGSGNSLYFNNNANVGQLTATTLSGTRTWTLPDTSGTICVSGSTCASSGTLGYWSRTGTTLSPSTSGDNITTSGDISTSGTGAITAAGTLTANGTFDANGQFDLGDGGDAGTISATTLDIDATGALQINSSGGAISIGNDAVAQNINIGTGAAARTVTIGNGTGATALNFTSGTGTQSFTSSVVSGTTTSSAFAFNAPSLTTGTALYVSSTATSGKTVDINASQTSGTIFNLAYGSAKTLTGDLTGLYVDLNSGNVDATNQNITGVNFKIPTVTDTHTSGTKTLTGMLVNFGSGAGINQNGVGGTLEYIAGDFHMPALTQTAGTLNAYGTKVTTPATITTGGTAYGQYISATGVGAGNLNGLGISSITGGSGTEYALSIGSGWDAILRVGSTTVINGSGVTTAVGGGTGQSSYAVGDILYADTTTTLAKRNIGNEDEVLAVVGGVPTWTTISGASCSNCLIDDPTADQIIAPTGQSTTGLAVRQTSTASPTDDIFQVTNSTGATKYFWVDKDGNVSTAGTSSQTLTLTPLTDTTALTLVGTNVTTQPLQYINANNSQGNILSLNYGAAQTLSTSTALTAFNIDLSTNVTATNASVMGTHITLPGATNTHTSGNKTLTGFSVDGGSLNQNGVGGTTIYTAFDATIPAITQTAGTMLAYGINVNTPSSITTAGTASGINVTATGVGAGTLNGLNIGSITAGAGTENGIQIGSGWDSNILLNDTTSRVALANGGTLTIVDTAGNSLCTITDNSTVGDLTCTGTISGSGSVGYWTRSGSTLSTATASDNVTVDGTTTANGTFDANGQFDLGDGGDAGTISATTLDIDATGALQINSSGGAISIGNDAVAQNINIGTGAAARTITMGNSTGATALNFTSGTGSQTFASSVATTSTTSSAFVFTANSLTSGTGAYVNSTSITTGKLFQLSTGAANTLTSGTLADIRTTSTALTGAAGTGSLMNLDWSPGSATTATGDLFALNIGSNGSTTGNLFNILDSSASIFSVSETAMTTSLPANFTSPGDVAIAYDLNFTNPVASYIKSYSALTIQPGDPFGSSNLTLSPYNEGSVYIPSNVATGYGVDLEANLLSSGAAMRISSTSSAGTGSAGVSYLLGLNRSGANTNASHVAVGLASTVTNTGTTSLNYAGYFLASGATLNYALVTAAGNVGFGDTTPSAQVEIGDGTDSLQISTVGDMLFVDANDAASITGPAGGALGIASANSQALNLTTTTAGNISLNPAGVGDITLVADNAATSYLNITGLASGTVSNALCQDSSGNVITCTSSSSAVSGTSGQVAFFNGANSVTSESSGFGWDATNNYFTIDSNVGTTYGAGVGTGLIDFASTSLTTGTLLNLELTEGTLNGGHYLKAWDATAGATVFSVGEDGRTIIAGVAEGTTSVSLTAGDLVVTDGDFSIAGGQILGATSTSIDLGVTTSGDILATGDFSPSTDDTYDLGDNTHRWKDLYLGGETLHIGTSTSDEGTISYNTTTNIFGFGTDSTSNGDIAFFTDDLYLDKSSGNVAIGNTAPGSRLSVTISSVGDGLGVYGNTSGLLSPQFSLYDSATQKAAYGLALDNNHYSSIAIPGDSVLRSLNAGGSGGNVIISAQNSTGNIKFATGTSSADDTAKMTILNGGNVGIGDASPASMFTVGSGDLFQVNSSGAIAAVTGYTQSSGAFAFSGGGNFSIDSAAFDVTTGGSISGVTGYSQASGTFNLTAADASLINLSAINVSSTTEGLILPQNATACSAATAEGQICWDTAGEDLYIGNGVSAVQMNGGAGSSAWSGITDPTGDQTLAFGDGEQNIWTISSDTETFWAMTADSMTTGDLFDISLDGLTTGTGFQMQSTSTALTGVAGTGSLMNLEWAPGSATLATGDLFALNIGANGSTTGNIFNLLDSGSSIFSVSETAFTTSLPSNFTAAGDTSMAYDLNFTNPTASYIKSQAPLAIVSGETFNSSNLTLGTYNQGTIVLSTNNTTTTAVDLTSSTLTTGTGFNMNFGAITSGTGLAVSTSNNTLSTGTLVTIASSSTGQTSGGLLSVVQSGVTTGFTGDVMRVVGSGTTGSGGTVLSLTGANTTAGTVLEVVGNTVTTTNGRVMTLTANALTSGIGVDISSSNTAGLTSGTLFRVAKTGASGNTAYTGDIAAISYAHTFNSTGTLSHTGNVLDLSRTLSLTGAATQTVSGAQLLIADSLTVNNASGTFTYSGDTVSISRAVTRTSGAITNSGNLMTLTSSDASHTGNTLSIADSATHASGGSSLLITASSITSGSALTVTGSSSAGVTGNFVNLTSDVGSAGSLLKLSPDFSGAGVVGYGVNVTATDSTANTNTDYGYYAALTLTGNAAKNAYGISTSISSNSTTADTLYGGIFTTTNTGNAIKSHYGLVARATSSHTTGDGTLMTGALLDPSVTGALTTAIAKNAYGLVASPYSTGNSTAGVIRARGVQSTPSSTAFGTSGNTLTSEVMGLFTSPTNDPASDCGASCISNTYGLYIDNGTTTTEGTSTKYGVYITAQSGSDVNYSLYTAGGTNYMAGSTSTLMIGTTTNDNASNVVIQSTPATTGTGLTIWDPYTTDGLARAEVIFRRGANNVGQISMSSTNTSYTDLSDIRLKENITQSSKGLNELMQVQVADYNFIVDPNRTQTGFLAQQLYTVFPDAVTKPINPEDRWYVDYGRITPLLAKSIQDLNNKVENALLTIKPNGTTTTNLNVDKITVSGDAKIGGLVSASNFALDASLLNRSGAMASVPVSGDNKVTLADTVNSLNSEINTLDSRLQTMDSTQASQSAELAQARILGEQAVNHAQTLDEKVASTSANLTSLSSRIDDLLASISGSEPESTDSGDLELTPPTELIATDSATFANLDVTENLSTLNIEAMDATVSSTFKSLGETFLGQTTIAGDLSVDGTLSFTNGNSINAFPTLFFQNNPLAQAVDFFNGKITLNAQGVLAAESLALGDQSVGTATIAAGQTEITIPSEIVAADSKIFLTPESALTGNIYVGQKVTGSGFKVKLSQPNTSPVKFNWMIVQTKETSN